MITSAEIRTKLVDALQLDLVGPTPDDGEHAHEVLIQAPSKWYLCGFLAPFGAAIDLKSDETVDEELDQQAGNAASEDAAVPEAAAARKVPFPSSMGLSFLVSEQVTELKATVCWGDYLPIDLEEEETQEEEEERRKQIGWQRVPQKAELTVPLSVTSQPKHIDVPGGSGLTLVIANRPVRSHRFAEGTRSVSVFLVNYRASSMDRDRDTTFAFQTSLSLECTEGFIPRSDPRGGESIDWDEAVASVQYRDEYEFAVGHNVSVIAKSEGKSCTKICTNWIPTAEVARVAPAYIPGIELSMEALASANDAVTLRQMVGPMVTAYESWITKQGKTPLQGHAAQVSQKLLQNADRARQRIAAGLTALDDPDVLDAFRLMNRVIATARRQQLSQEEGKPAAEFEPPSWRPFQIAFILLNLVSIAEPEHPDREVVDLLFFPTGGGKTEAYLGLAAFALVLRRLRNPGIQAAGVSVLMRYTLRLLTLDQLERASRLICALELERQQDKRLGTWPFEIGLWVGQSATPNRMGKKGDKNDEYSARARTLAFQRDDRSKPSPIPLEKCPWCGEKFKAVSFQLLPDSDAPKDLRVICSNRRCSFRGDNPLPIIAVDEPIYRRLPCFIIATVDKFANLPWVGQTGALFGKVTHHSEKEGFYGPADPTKVGKPLPGHLPPPDLVIQDELHLISGPLGTMVGLYETAIDRLCCVQKNGKAIRPKVIASTATVRRADRQIQALFGRSHVDIFPPPGPDRHDSFFAETISTDKSPGRLYIGVAAQGRSLKVVLLRAYLALLAAACKEWEDVGGAKASPNPADPYMTLLGYFNSLRELGGSRRIIEDEVNSRLIKYGERRLRYGEESGPFANRKIDDEPEELTSRVSTNKVANTKRRLALPFTETERVDVALATNMISVGLDIVRLGLMVVLGQPKTAAEYIQTTSRVGRDSNRPGLVVTLLNIHRPRDRSHYERFQSWHASFYRAVEATSVTPFSPRALDRGLAGVTVALARMSIDEMPPPLGASQVEQNRSALEAVVNTIAHRAEGHNPDLLADAAETLRQEVRSQVIDLLDTWERISDREKRIQYNKQEVDLAAPLLLDAFDPKADEAPEEQQKFKTQRSLRDVEPTVNVWVRDPAGQEIDGESI
ncbi:helicase [Leptolyngbya sp. 'hensonii']|uniref:DISARM system helicase DrmA n=1 Tax=Leptolyngbya sp. 'hensonii' TaxID=1922337 RepID=UPI00094F826B|nr:DISARM system helicase DrmA [Leptolyngbya sp. 'hensonii']OLP15933.1 helicase [Leptolyngbya sp. 'hensonii']